MDWAWTGDQGLMLANFSDAVKLHPAESGVLLSLAQAVLAGVRQKMFRNGEVQSWTATGWVPDGAGYELDYSTGAGVFWRNFLYVWQNNTVLRSVMQNDYVNMLRDSGTKVASLPTDKVPFVELTNRLAVLVAATAILS